MFLSRRATQAEYCDRTDLPSGEVADNYRQLARFNRFMLVSDPFQRLLVRWLGRGGVKTLSLLDLGAGDGSTGRSMEAWARSHGWDWRVTNLDLNIQALRLNPGRRNVTAAVGALPFALLAPQPGHAHRGAQLPGLCLLLARDRERPLEIGFRLCRFWLRGHQHNFACNAMYLGLAPSLLGRLGHAPCLRDAPPRLLELTELRISSCQN